MSANDSKYTSNVSTEAAVDLADFVESLELENGVYNASVQDINNMSIFLGKQFNIISLVQIQSFCATKNDHTSLSSINDNMKTLIHFANATPELHNAVKPLISELISSHNIKVFYRCFSNEHPSITIPAISLLTEIVAFEKGCFIDQLLENFDLSLKTLKDLFYPTKASAKLSSTGKSNTTVRHFMSIFWITLCSNASPLTRIDLLSNNKPINFTWIKFTTEFDNADLIRKMFKFFDEKVLMEPAYRKMTKCKLLGDNTLSKFVELYSFDEVSEEVHALLMKITTDEVNGLLFHDYRTWFNNVPLNVLPFNSAFNNSGVPVIIGEDKFKINNKIIYKILTSLKPWSNSLHLNLAIAILSNASELSAPYTCHLFYSNGSHDPKMTSFYIGQTLILTKITQLPIPTEFVSMIKKYISDTTEESIVSIKSSSYLSSKILMEVVCPSPLNRSALTQGLIADNKMTRHLTVQLIVSIIQKFNKVYKLLNFNENSIFTSIRNELKDTLINLKLPDASAIVGATNDCLKDSKLNKLLLLNYMKAAECYNKVLDINISLQLGSFNNILGIKMDENFESSENSFISQSKMTDLDLLIFNSYLTLTANSSISNTQNKWWNITKGSKNTLFTTIARLPYDLQFKEDEDKTFADNNLITKVVEVLANFIDDSLAFEDYRSSNTNILNSQAWAIVLSLLNSFNSLKDQKIDIIDSICKVLDESISRSLRTPYKYYDVITKHATELKLKNIRVSAFFVALSEQSKFTKPEHKEYVNQWIKLLTIYLFLLGESLPIMKSILKEYCELDIEFDLSTYESFIKSNSVLNINISNFTNVAFTQLNKLKSTIGSLIPKSDIEIIALIDRIHTIIEFDIDLKQVDDLILDMCSLYGNYIVHKYSGFIDDEITINNVELLEKKYWINLLVNIEEAENSTNHQMLKKKYFVMGLLNEIFKSLWNNQISLNFKTCLQDYIFKLANHENISELATKHISEFLWVLSDKQISELIVSMKFNECTEPLIDIAISRNLKFESTDIMGYFENQITISSELSKKFVKLMKDVDFDDEQILKLIKLIKSNGNDLLYGVLENVCKHDSSKIDLICDKLNDKFDSISSFFEGFKFLQFLSISYHRLRVILYNIATEKIDSILKFESSVDDSLNIYIYSIVLYIDNNNNNDSESTTKEIQNQIGELISMDSIRNVASLIFSPQMTQLVFSLYGKNKEKDNTVIINNWLHRAMLYITKVFAETIEDNINIEFEKFLSCLRKSFHSSIWKYVNKNMINSQLEVILSKGWVKYPNILKYTTWIIMTGSKNVVESVKLVNIFLNNTDNVLMSASKNEESRYYSALILSYLFKMNLKQLSSFDILSRIVKLYRGTVFASDLVLKDLLMHIEQESGESWIQLVSNWDLIDEWLPNNSSGDNENNNSNNKIINVPEFIIDTPGLTDYLTVNLHKIIIENTVKNFDTNKRSIFIPELQNTIESQEDDFNKIEEFYDLKHIDSIEIDGEVIYDVEFILLLIVNNEDLFKIGEDSVVVNIRALIDTWLLQLTICGLAHELKSVNEISKRIISSIILNIEDDIKNLENKKEKKQERISDDDFNNNKNLSISTFKERSAFKVYLGNLLYTFEDKKNIANESGNSVESVSKLFIIFLSYLTPILANPAHFLYEKAYRFILGGSKYRDYEIPMYKSIMVDFTKDEHTKSSDDDSDYYKQLQWIIRTLSLSITSNEDLKIIRRNEVIEQLLNLINSPFITYGLQESILNVFEKIIRLENGGDLLIRSFGLLSFVESRGLAKKNKMWEKYTKLAMKSVIGSECNGKDKRSLEWCNDDFDNVVKRVCL